MNAHDFLDGFQFQNDAVINNAVNPIAAIKIQVFVGHWHWALKPEGQICQAKFIRQTLLGEKIEIEIEIGIAIEIENSWP